MKRKILTETSGPTYSHSDFDQLFGPVKKALGHFGKTVTASAKLVGNDIGTLMRLTLNWRTHSLSTQKKIMSDWKSDRTRHQKELLANSTAALEGFGADKWTCMMMCPAVFWTDATLRGTADLFSEETRARIGDFGVNKMPVLGRLFSGEFDSRDGLWDKLTRSDADPNSPEGRADFENAFQSWAINDLGVPSDHFKVGGTTPTGLGGPLKRIFYDVNQIFLLGAGKNTAGDVMLEGEEEESKQEAKKRIVEEVVIELISEYMKKQKLGRPEYIKEHFEVFDGAVSAVEKVLELNTAIATSDDPDEFFKIVKTTVSKNKELKDIDVESMEAEFNKMVEKLSADENTISLLRKDLETSGEIKKQEEESADSKPPSAEEQLIFEKHLKNIALDNCKGTFLQTFKEGALDMYDTMYFEVSDGLQKETIELILKDAGDDPLAMEYIAQVESFRERLDQALSKLKK